MRATTTLRIPQPCAESWAAMSPTAAGRHCTACATEVIDFTYLTDTEILAYFAKAGGARVCGRFAVGQLERPLLPATATASAARWRAWLAAAVALWSLREVPKAAAQAQPSAEWRARYWGGPVPAAPPAATPSAEDAVAAAGVAAQLTHSVPSTSTGYHAPGGRIAVRGTVRDASTQQPLPGVVVFMAGLSSNVSTDQWGNFQLALPTKPMHKAWPELAFRMPGYQHQQCSVPGAGTQLDVYLTADPQAAGVEVVAQGLDMRRQSMTLGGAVTMVVYDRRRPWPWHPRHFYYWSKYWLTRPFHRKQN